MPATLAIDRPCEPRAFQRRFDDDLADFAASCRALWFEGDPGLPDLGERFDRRERRRAGVGASALLDRLERGIERSSRNRAGLAERRTLWRREVADFAVEHLRLRRAQVDLLLGDDWLRATSQFARHRGEIVPEVAEDDLYQALRNGWIANVLQRLLGRPLELTPAIFGYSMLYPLTDNPLDDPRLTGEHKRAAGERLRCRLEGASLAARDREEAAVFRMVGMIESQYPRELFPGVWAALLAIHRAQLASLAQQDGVVSPYACDVLGLSIAKGGSSVLVDGYLAAGDLEPGQARACFTLGVLLQLLDDLQDTREDLRAGRSTIFTQTARAWPLDVPTARLWSFALRLLHHDALFKAPENEVMASLVERGVAFLLLCAVAEQPELFSRGFRRHLEGFSPVSFAYLRREQRRMQKRQHRVRRVLAAGGKVESVWEVLG